MTVYDVHTDDEEARDLTEPSPPFEPELTFEVLRQKNKERLAAAFPQNIGWQPPLWALCVAGEAGEVANAVKQRYLEHRQDEVSKIDIGHEIADVVIYLDLLATSMGYRLEDLVLTKFNIVSARKKCEVFL